MFIEITTPTNPLRIENILHPYKHGKKPFTPEVAEQIITSTNYPRSIRDMLTLITNLPVTEQAQYKNLVLSAFDHREQPNDITIIGKKLALANNYEDELNQIINHTPTIVEGRNFIYASAINEIGAYIYDGSYPNLSKYPPNATIYFTNDTVDLPYKNLSTVKNLKFKKGSKVNLNWSTNLPKDLDVSMCNKVSLSYVDLSQIKSLKFKEGSIINLIKSENLPEDLDVSMCSKIYLSHVNLSSVSPLKFKKDSEVDFRGCKNLPEDLDVSMCSSVDLSETDLSPVKNLKFKEGSEVFLYNCKNLPEDLDVSMCSKVDLLRTNLSKIKSLKFKEESTVNLSYCENLPENLDISKCDTVNLYSANISNVKTLTFKNKTQQKECNIEIPEDWQGKIIYTQDTQTISAFRFQTSNSR